MQPEVGEENPSRLGRRKREKSKKSRKGVAEETSSKKGGIEKNTKEKKVKKRNLAKDGTSEKTSSVQKKAKAQNPSDKHHDSSKPQATVVRKTVDPETAKFFSEIAKQFENSEIDLEDRSTICGHALEETRGKEVELSTDMIISHTLQSLLEGCDLDQLCEFLRNCAKDFPFIAQDKFGSHVAETALKALSVHLEDEDSHLIIGDSLAKICQVVVHDPANLMCSCYGSHVLRSLLCLCKGVPLDSLEQFHVAKTSIILAKRLNSNPVQSVGNNPQMIHHGFEQVFKFLVREMLNHAKDQIKSLMGNKYSSLVLQTALKLSKGDDQLLLDAILILLGCHERNITQGNFIEPAMKQEIMNLLEDTSSSHLLEVIIEMAPDAVYTELLYEIFKGSLFEISLHQCGNFVVQALISSARSSDQVDLIWAELGSKLRELLESGKPGVTASLLAACQRVQTNGAECCQALAAAVSSESESSSCIISHILFLESYLKKKSCWKWPAGEKMQTLGCLMLQTVFRFPKHFIHPYITSMRSMEADHIFQAAKDLGGSRVLEAFLCSDASAQEKRKLIAKLQNHFGELSMHPSSSFTVERCFTASNMTLREAIAAELVAIQPELSKTKHGPYLLKKLDIDEFAKRPDQWKARQASKESTYQEFQAAFGSDDRHQKKRNRSTENPKKKHRRHRMAAGEIDQELDASNAMLSSEFLDDIPGLESSLAKLGFPDNKRCTNFIRGSARASPATKTGKSKSTASELADLAGKTLLSQSDVRKLMKASAANKGKHAVDEKIPFLRKKQKK